MPKLSALLTLGLSAAVTLGDMIRINDVNDFVRFSENVNSRVSYDGTTVILEGDIVFTEELSKQFEPIGKNYSDVESCFKGVFDGQGYTISNLKMNSTNAFVGLFGFSSGNITIRNTIIDSSCSFESTYDQGFRVGGFIAYLWGSTGGMLIDNSINMASISFTGTTNNAVEIGGFVGDSMAYKYETHLVNCVNYGSIKYTGTVTKGNTQIGGFIGNLNGADDVYNTIKNCANYGEISVGGSSQNLLIGGIIGYNYYCLIKSSLSAGKLSTTSYKKSIGTIVGNTLLKGNITDCYWTSDVGSYEASGNGMATVTDSSLITSNDEALNKLNTNAEANSWSKWLLITNNATVSFKPNSNGKAVELTSTFTLIPEFKSEWKDFEGWFDGNTKFTATTISENKELTGKWIFDKDFTLSFDFGNGTVLNETYKLDAPVTYPVVADANNKFYLWDKYITTMPGEDTVIQGRWMNVSAYVEVTFASYLSREEANQIVSLYTSDDFTIVDFAGDWNYTRVIMQFASTTGATNFVKTALSNKTPDDKITKIETVEAFVPPVYSSSEESSSSKKAPSSSSSSTTGSSSTGKTGHSSSVISEESSSKTSEESSSAKSFSSSLCPFTVLLFLLR